MIPKSIVKTIDSNGQIFLGEEFAGRKVFIDVPETGVWLIRSTDIVPQSEHWLHEPDEQKNLEDAMTWAIKHSASSKNTKEILCQLQDEIGND